MLWIGKSIGKNISIRFIRTAIRKNRIILRLVLLLISIASLSLLKDLYHFIVVFSHMRKYTVHTAFYLLSLYFHIFIITGTVIFVQRAIAEKAVDIHAALVTGIVFTFLVSKKTA